MKVATISTTTPKVVRRELKTGDRIKVIHSKSVESNTKCTIQSIESNTHFTVQSVARDGKGMVHVMINSPLPGETALTLIMKTDSPSLLIGKTIDELVINEIYYANSDIKCEIADSGKWYYGVKINEPVDRPVIVGDVFKSVRREYRVEYIAEDGSLVCRSYSRKTNEYTGLIIMTPDDRSLVESVSQKIRWTYA